MFKQIIMLIFTTLVIIYAQNPNILQNSSITTTKEAEGKLAPIHISEALPIVQFEVFPTEATSTSTSTSTSTLTSELHSPHDIIEAVTVGRKMVKGTTFYRVESQKQIFFCPKKESRSACLIPQNYGDLEQLKCSKEPIPTVKEVLPEMKCSDGLDSNVHMMVYNICPSEPPYRYKTTEIILYTICYNKEKSKTVYTNHFIKTPKLLKSKLLHREHNLSYSFPAGELRIAKYWAIKNSLDSESNPFVTANRPLYRVQTLVPSADITFGSVKKAIFQFANADLQHREVFPFWEEINEKVRANAILIHDNDFTLWYQIVTCVFDLTAEIEGERQLYNMWVKMITLKKLDKNMQGVVILMNNFIDSPNQGSPPKFVQNTIDNFCPKNLCADDIKNRVENIGGRMRCCSITEKVKVLIGLQKNPTTQKIGDVFGQTSTPLLPVLPIPDLIKI